MAFNRSNIWNPTPEERAAAKQAAQEERERIIQQAINNGAKVQHITSRLTSEEWETHISYGYDNICTIDTTIPSDITECIKKGWNIRQITYYKGTNQIVGIVCEAKSNNISIRNVKDRHIMRF